VSEKKMIRVQVPFDIVGWEWEDVLNGPLAEVIKQLQGAEVAIKQAGYTDPTIVVERMYGDTDVELHAMRLETDDEMAKRLKRNAAAAKRRERAKEKEAAREAAKEAKERAKLAELIAKYGVPKEVGDE